MEATVQRFRHVARSHVPTHDSRRGSQRRTPANPTGQDGSSLIEVIIAVFLVSMVVLGLATAFIALMRINRANSEQQRVDHAVDNVAEQLKAVIYDPDGTWQERMTTYSGGVTPPLPPDLSTTNTDSDPAVVLTRVECRTTGGAATLDEYNSCTGADSGTQRISIRGEFRDRTRTAQIVVRQR